MANKLRDLFLHKDTHFVTFIFKDEVSKKDFITKMSQLYSDFKTEYVELDGIDCINLRQPISVGEYTSSNNYVTGVKVSLNKEKIRCIIQVSDENYTLDLLRTQKLHGFILSTLPDFPIELQLSFDSACKQLNIKYTINYSLCDYASDWIKYLTIIINLFLYFTNPAKNNLTNEISSILINLYRLKGFFERIQKLESTFNTHFSTISLTDSENNILDIELLYQTIINGLPIKENISYMNISSPIETSIPLPKVGTRQMVYGDHSETIIIDNQKFSFDSQQFFFNAVVNSVEKLNENQNKIIFTGTDEMPLYSVKKYYLSSSDIPKITGNITDLILPIMNAKTLSEILSDLANQERTEVEELLKKGGKNIKMKIIELENTTKCQEK